MFVYNFSREIKFKKKNRKEMFLEFLEGKGFIQNKSYYYV